MIITFADITNLTLYILPGYLVIYVINLLTDYLTEKTSFDKTIHYVVFTLLSYACAAVTLYLVQQIFSIIGFTTTFPEHYALISLAFVYAAFLGFMLAQFYFKKGYPNKHFRKYSNKKFMVSIHADLLNQYRHGAWVTFHMKDNTIVQGKCIEIDRNEQQRDYVYVIKNAQRYDPKQKIKFKLKGEKIAINVRDAIMIEFNR